MSSAKNTIDEKWILFNANKDDKNKHIEYSKAKPCAC